MEAASDRYSAPYFKRTALPRKDVRMQLSAVRPLVRHDPPDPPQYFVIGGLVFVPLSEPFLSDDFGNSALWQRRARDALAMHGGRGGWVPCRIGFAVWESARSWSVWGSHWLACAEFVDCRLI